MVIDSTEQLNRSMDDIDLGDFEPSIEQEQVINSSRYSTSTFRDTELSQAEAL